MQLQRGQRSKLVDLSLGQQFSVALDITGGNLSFDTACFGLDHQERLSNDAYMVFYNQVASPDQAIIYSAAQEHVYTMNLAVLNSSIQKLVFTITAPEPHSLTSVDKGSIVIRQPNGTEAARYSFTGKDFTAEKAVMGLELYLKDGVWRLHACGQGFAGGLDALVMHFGGEVASPTPQAAPVIAPPAPVVPAAMIPPPVIPPPAPPKPSVSLTKVTLEKRGEVAKISLRKEGSNAIHVNLNWNQQAKRGFLGMSTPAADLDLGCMFEMMDGNKGVLQALGNKMGQKGQYPFIYVDKDDRSGASANGENLFIERPDLIKRVMIFAYIYEGAKAGFQGVEGRMGMTDPAGNEIKLSLNNPDDRLTFCCVALIQQIHGEVSIRKDEKYFQHHEQADQHYGFGFRWSAGSKD
jgi:tellurite resistance protein TerA